MPIEDRRPRGIGVGYTQSFRGPGTGGVIANNNVNICMYVCLCVYVEVIVVDFASKIVLTYERKVKQDIFGFQNLTE